MRWLNVKLVGHGGMRALARQNAGQGSDRCRGRQNREKVGDADTDLEEPAKADYCTTQNTIQL